MFQEALNQIIRRLDGARAKHLIHAYALVGGFAVSAWGVARATQDIDLAIALGASDPHALTTHLGAVYEPGDSDDPLRGVFRLVLKSHGVDVPIQLIVLPPKWREEVFQGLETVTVFDCAVPVVGWQSLVLMKLYAGGPVDLQDAKGIVAVQRPSAEAQARMVARAGALGLAEEMNTLLHRST